MTTSAPVVKTIDVPYPLPREPLRLPQGPEPLVVITTPVRIPVTVPVRRSRYA